MTSGPRAAFVAIGDELISGTIRDGNGDFIRDYLAERGIRLVERRIVADDETAIRRAIVELAPRVDLLITTGGLGPTEDDLTHAAVAAALGRPVVIDAQSAERIRSRLEARGRSSSPAQLQMAAVPEGAIVLPNEVGAAPGSLTRHDDGLICVLPGVPGEMRRMMEGPLDAHLPRGPTTAFERFSVFGMSESEVDAEVTPWLSPSTRYGIRNDGLVNHVRLTGSDFGALERDARALSERLGPRLFSRSEEPLEAVVGERLAAVGATVATAESCTGGWVSQALTATPGSSRYVSGGVVAYANEAKIALLGVSEALLEAEGAVSEGVALAMAQGARVRLGATWGVSTTGIAGPGGGRPDKPVGTVWVAWAGPDGAKAARLQLPPERRDLVRWLSVQAVLGGLLDRIPHI